MRWFLAAFFFIILLKSPACAVFVESQMERIDHEPLFDSYYFLSLRSFSYPADWDRLWSGSTAAAYRINAASLDCCDLFLEQEVRLQRQIAKTLAFKYRLVQNEDKERREFHQWIELDKRFGQGFSASIFGEPTFHKEDADIGFGAGYERGSFKVGTRHTFVDFNFNKRGHTGERYNRMPHSDEFSAEFTQGNKSLRASLELDHPIARKVPLENRVFSYRRTTLSLALRHQVPNGFSRRLEYGYEFQKKGNLFDSDLTAASIENRRRVHRAELAWEGSITSHDHLEAGGALLVRNARTDNARAGQAGVFYRRWECQPSARWRRNLVPWLISDIGTFLSFGENRRRYSSGVTPGGYDRLIEAKLGTGLDFIFGSLGRIGIYGTFALDRPSHPWGGGNARAMFLF